MNTEQWTVNRCLHSPGCSLLCLDRTPLRSLYSSVAERWSCKPKVMSSILIGGKIFSPPYQMKSWAVGNEDVFYNSFHLFQFNINTITYIIIYIRIYYINKIIMTPTWFEHAAFWSGVRRATVAPRSHTDKSCSKRLRFYRDLNSDRWIQSPEC